MWRPSDGHLYCFSLNLLLLLFPLIENRDRGRRWWRRGKFKLSSSPIYIYPFCELYVASQRLAQLAVSSSSLVWKRSDLGIFFSNLLSSSNSHCLLLCISLRPWLEVGRWRRRWRSGTEKPSLIFIFSFIIMRQIVMPRWSSHYPIFFFSCLPLIKSGEGGQESGGEEKPSKVFIS